MESLPLTIAGADDIEAFKRQLGKSGKDAAQTQDSIKSIWSVPGRLLVFLLALAATTFLTGTLLRFNMHHIQHPTVRDSHEPGNVRIRVDFAAKRKGFSEPNSQAAELHGAEDWSAGSILGHESEDGQRSSVETFLNSDKCKPLLSIYSAIVASQLAPFKKGLIQELLSTQRHEHSVFLSLGNGDVFSQGNATDLQHPMARLWGLYLYQLSKRVRLPDAFLPFNSGDFAIGGGQNCWFSFCRKTRIQNDLLLPNTLEDDLFLRLPKQATSMHQPDLASRLNAAIWLGRPMSWERGYRKAILETSRAYPHKVYAGLTDWNNGSDIQQIGQEALLDYFKPNLPVERWGNQFKYALNVPGNCGSSRLAYQLYSDAAVFLVISEDEEWYFPLLQPYVHYVPVTVNADGTSDLIAQIEWADQHAETIADIIANAKQFAIQHLSPGSGRDCYSTMLINQFSKLTTGQSVLQHTLKPFNPDSLYLS